MRTFFDDKVDFFEAMEERSPFSELLDDLVTWADLGGTRGRVADLGAGPGGLLRRIEGPSRVALDFSHPMGLRAMQQGQLAIQADAMSLPLKSGTFDAVFATNLLHLVPDPALVAAEAHRVLAPGGAFLAIVPGPRMSESSLRSWLAPRHGEAIAEMLAGWGRSAEANRRFTIAELRELLSSYREVQIRPRWDDHALLARGIR